MYDGTLKVGDIVSWDSSSWTVTECGAEKEPLPDGTEGGWLCEIYNDTNGLWLVREADVTITAWAPQPVTRNGDEGRPVK